MIWIIVRTEVGLGRIFSQADQKIRMLEIDLQNGEGDWVRVSVWRKMKEKRNCEGVRGRK